MHWISVKFEMGDIPEPLAGHVVHLLRQPVVVLNTNIVNDSIQSSKYSTPLEEPGEISQIQGWGAGAGRSRVFLDPWKKLAGSSALREDKKHKEIVL